jgi:hypothetical protein
MSRTRTLFTRIVLPHLLVAPLVAAYVHRDVSRRGHPTPSRAALRYGALGIPGAILYERSNAGESAAEG